MKGKLIVSLMHGDITIADLVNLAKGRELSLMHPPKLGWGPSFLTFPYLF